MRVDISTRTQRCLARVERGAVGRWSRRSSGDFISPNLLAPCTPSKIVCVGRNYAAHAKELGNEVPKEPLLFFKPPSSLVAAGGVVRLPPESERVEYEAEIAVVIGQRLRRATEAQAIAAIFGYTAACDVTARDLQKKDGQWTRAKGFDTFCPLGPWIVSRAEVPVGISLSRQRRRKTKWSHRVTWCFPCRHCSRTSAKR